MIFYKAGGMSFLAQKGPPGSLASWRLPGAPGPDSGRSVGKSAKIMKNHQFWAPAKRKRSGFPGPEIGPFGPPLKWWETGTGGPENGHFGNE